MPNSKTDLNENSLLAAFEEAAKRGPIAIKPTNWVGTPEAIEAWLAKAPPIERKSWPYKITKLREAE